MLRAALFSPAILALSACGSLQDNAERSLGGKPQATGKVASKTALAKTLFRSTAIASLNQPLTTARTGLAVMWNRPRAILTGNIPLLLPSAVSSAHPPGTPGFEQSLTAAGCPPPSSGTLRWLVDGREFFPELDRVIAGTEKELAVQMFIFDNDDIAVRYAGKLRQLAETRKVKVLFDDLGSTTAHGSAPETTGPAGFHPPADMLSHLRKNSPLKARRNLNPWLVCDHTKLIVADGRTALLGGMNIGREYYSEWHDLMLRTDGPVAADLEHIFRRAWGKAGIAGDLALFRRPYAEKHPRSPAPGDIPIRILRTDSATSTYQIFHATVLAIRAAKKRVWVENPYFAHDGIARELAAAAKRGVDVRVIIPTEGDSAVMRHGNLATAATVLEAGGKVFQYPGMTHMKVMIADDWAQAGSANLDTLSLRINGELNIAVSDRKTVAALERKVFRPDFRRSRTIGKSEVKSMIAPLAEIFADQL